MLTSLRPSNLRLLSTTSNRLFSTLFNHQKRYNSTDTNTNTNTKTVTETYTDTEPRITGKITVWLRIKGFVKPDDETLPDAMCHIAEIRNLEDVPKDTLAEMELETTHQGKQKIKYMPVDQRVSYNLVHARPELKEKGWQCEKVKLLPPWNTTMLLRDVISETPGVKVVTPKVITWAIEEKKKKKAQSGRKPRWLGRGEQRSKID